LRAAGRKLIPVQFLETLAITVVAIVISLILFGLFVMFTGRDPHGHAINPFDVYGEMFRGAFGTAFSWRSTLVQSAPLLLTALCVAMPARVGMVIIGGEGAVVIGGLLATVVGLRLPNAQPFMLFTCMAVVGMIAGGAWIAISGALRQFRGVNETISSLLMNYIAIKILSHCIEGPMHDGTFSDQLASRPIHLAIESMLIPGTDIHVGFALGIVVCILMWVLMDHTTIGFSCRIVGGNPRAARVAGLSIQRYAMLACFLGGAAAGLAGAVEVAAVHGRANANLAAGYGYAGILVAFIARQNPIGVIPVAILMGGVVNGGSLLQSYGLSDATVQVFQGTLFLVMLGLDTWSGRIGEIRNAGFLKPIIWLARAARRKPLTGALLQGGAHV
jgi:simple sugar transport system permease protein